MLLVGMCDPTISSLHWDHRSWSRQPVSPVTFVLLTHLWNNPISEMGNWGTQELRTESAMRLGFLIRPTFSCYGGHQVLVPFPSKWSLQRSFFYQRQVSIRLFDPESLTDIEDLLNSHWSWGDNSPEVLTKSPLNYIKKAHISFKR